MGTFYFGVKLSKTFSITDFAKGASYATREYGLYMDQELLAKCVELDGLSNATLDAEESNRYDAELKALLPELQKSRITIHLRGIPRKVRRQLFAASQGQENPAEYYATSLLMAHVTHISDWEGNVDDTKWSYETGQEWLEPVTESDLNNLMELMGELQIDASKFDRDVTPDFLSKS